MKTFALFIAFWGLTSITFALQPLKSDPETLACRKYAIDLHIGLTASQITRFDLTHGLWTDVDFLGGRRLYQFNDDGLADILESGVNGSVFYRNIQWRVEDFDGLVMLFLKQSGEFFEELFNIELTCEGVVLTNLEEREMIHLSYSPLPDKEIIHRKVHDLLGEWTNVTLTHQPLKGSFRTIKFRHDGTFSLERDDLFQTNREQGTWELSKDGEYLLLYLCGEGRRNIQEVIVAKTGRIDSHSLELFHPVEMAEGNVDVRKFAFIR